MISKQDVLNKLREKRNEWSDWVNPQDQSGTCLYTDYLDPDKHCIAGQLCVEFNQLVPHMNGNFHDCNEGDFSLEAIDLIANIQDAADGNYGPSSVYYDDSEPYDGPRPWGMVIDRCLEVEVENRV